MTPEPQKLIEDQQKLLWNAVIKGDHNALESVLKGIPQGYKKMLLNTQFSTSGYSVLSAAIANHPDNSQTIALIDLLIAHGANLTTRDPGKPDSVDFLNTPLLNAIAQEKWILVLHLIELCNKDILNMWSLAHYAKNTPLILALKKQITPYNVIKALLDKGADPNVQNHGGETSLHYAAFMGDQQLIQTLLEHHADPNIKNKSGLTPYDLYISHALYTPDKLNQLSFIIADKKNGFPVFIFSRNFSENDRVVMRYFSNLPECLSDVYDGNFIFRMNSNYPPFQIIPEFVFPNSKNTPIFPLQPISDDIKQRLQPRNFNANALTSLIQQYNQENKEQNEAVKTGRVYLETDISDINIILCLFNEYITSNTSASLQLLELRSAVAKSNSFDEAKKCLEEAKAMLSSLAPELSKNVNKKLAELMPESVSESRLRIRP